MVLRYILGLWLRGKYHPLSIFLSEVEVNENYIFGANLDAASDVTVTGSSFSRNTPPADQSDWGLNNKPVINNIELDLVPSGGLTIQSGGNVTLSLVTANDNLMFGADILANGFVDIEDSVFSNNLNGSGLTAKSTTDEIRLTNVIAMGNGLDGANLETACDSVYVTGGNMLETPNTACMLQTACSILVLVRHQYSLLLTMALGQRLLAIREAHSHLLPQPTAAMKPHYT